MKRHLYVLCALSLGCLSWAQTNLLQVDLGSTRSSEDATAAADARVKAFAKNVSLLTQQNREALRRAGHWNASTPIAFPTRVDTYRNGAKLRTVRNQTRAPGITLQFATGARAFPPAYQNLLQSVFDNAVSTMDAIFGPAAIPGIVEVANFDDDIGDRDAVAGGYYLPNNGSGVRQIRFPVYQSNEAAAVNFIHTLLLAYQSDTTYSFDAFQEGLVRAATMRIVRQSSAVPGLDGSVIESALENSYDVGPHYDWYNQRALAGPRFIAPNLRDVPLPAGGSLGGIYLLRYKMAGSAWQKVLAEYPTFIAQFNQRFLNNIPLGANAPSLVTVGQQVLDQLRPTDPTIEGQSFADWYARQSILDVRQTPGLKLHVEPLPITSGLAGTDFGVFLIQTTYFETLANGNENLLGGTSYPIFWNTTYDRVLPNAQSEKMDIAGAYGSVAPNFENQNAGQPYRVAFDIPVQDRLVRGYLPAGSIATPANPTPNTFYGTVVGATAGTGATLQVRLQIGSEVIDAIPVVNGAFGIGITSPNFLGARSVSIELWRVSSSGNTLVLSRRVNKGPGPLAVDLRVNSEVTGRFAFGISRGLQLVGISAEPYESFLPNLLAIPPGGLLAARYNSSKARYDLYPDSGQPLIGQGYFVRSPIAGNPTFAAKGSSGQFLSVALRPGWNMIANPLNEDVPVSRLQVIRTTGFPRSIAEAAGEDIGADIFGFTPGAVDGITGAPEGGTYSATNTLIGGQGYFVRCLAPEGVTLLFRTAGGAGAPNRSPNSSGSNGSRPSQVIRAVVSSGRESTEAFLQMSRTGSDNVSSREDMALPPSIGGLQLALGGSANLYRETRRTGPEQRFQLKVTGVRNGIRYRLNLTTQVGEGLEMIVRDGDTRRTIRLRGQGVMEFTPRGSEATFEVVVRGAR